MSTMPSLRLSSAVTGQIVTQGAPFSVAPIDEHTGELLFFNYGTEAPYMHYGLVSPEGALAHYVDVPLRIEGGVLAEAELDDAPARLRTISTPRRARTAQAGTRSAVTVSPAIRSGRSQRRL